MPYIKKMHVKIDISYMLNSLSDNISFIRKILSIIVRVSMLIKSTNAENS